MPGAPYLDSEMWALAPANHLHSSRPLAFPNIAGGKIFLHLTKAPLRIGYNGEARQKIVPYIHRNPRFFKTLHFDTQCLQDFASFTYRQVST